MMDVCVLGGKVKGHRKRIKSHTSLSRNLSKSNLSSFSMLFSFSFRLDTSDISSSFWVSSAVLQRSSYKGIVKKQISYVVSANNTASIGTVVVNY